MSENKIVVPKYSRKKLRFLAHEWLNSIDIDLFEYGYLNIEKIFKFLAQNFNVVYKEIQLGSVSNQKILGLMSVEKNAIYIDPILNQNLAMKRFTQAHEIAHWLLHRNCDLVDYNLADTQDSLHKQHNLKSTYDWVEWQANTFAAFILIPQKRFIDAFNNALKKLSINKNSFSLNPAEFSKVQKILAFKFNVSKTVIGIYYQQLKKEQLLL